MPGRSSVSSRTRSESVHGCSLSASCLETVLKKTSCARALRRTTRQCDKHRIQPHNSPCQTSRRHAAAFRGAIHDRASECSERPPVLVTVCPILVSSRNVELAQLDRRGLGDWIDPLVITQRTTRHLRRSSRNSTLSNDCDAPPVSTVDAGIRVPELLARTVSRHDAESESPGTGSRRVRNDKLWSAGDGVPHVSQPGGEGATVTTLPPYQPPEFPATRESGEKTVFCSRKNRAPQRPVTSLPFSG